MDLNLKKPKSNKAEVLYVLIENGKVSIKDFPYLSGFRTRISELVRENNLNLESKNMTDINKFGNTFTFVEHQLPEYEKTTAIEIYNTINHDGRG